MTIHLPTELESRLYAVVRSGRFVSINDAMTEALRLLFRELDQQPPANPLVAADEHGPDLFLGSMRDAADELDEIVADAYRKRQEETWRDISVE